MTTSTPTNPCPDIQLPAGADFGDNWEGDPPSRMVLAPTRGVTDTDVIVWASATQIADGCIAPDFPDYPPRVHIDVASKVTLDINSDQARELAAALLEAAAELDGWVA